MMVTASLLPFIMIEPTTGGMCPEKSTLHELFQSSRENTLVLMFWNNIVENRAKISLYCYSRYIAAGDTY